MPHLAEVAARPIPGTENEILILTLVLVAALAGLVNFAFGQKTPRRSRPRDHSYRSGGFAVDQKSAVQHFGQQLQSVMVSTFEKRRIMNGSEYRAFRIIEEDIASIRMGHRVFAQTCLGEILQSKDENAFYSINSKRVDILIVDKGGWPVLAVEYQGEGHFQGTAAARDAIKKEALRKAGVRYLEVVPGDSDEQIRRRVREHLGLDAPVALPSSLAPPPAPPLRRGFGLRISSHQPAVDQLN